MERSNLALPFTLLILLSSFWACQNTQQNNNKDKKATDTTAQLADSARIAKLMKMGEGTPSVEHFFKNPKKTSFKLSPNGKYIAYLGPYKNRLNVHVKKLGAKKAKRITHETDRDIQAYFWGNNDKIIYLQDSAGNENFHLYAANRDGSGVDSLTPFSQVRAKMVDPLRDQPQHMIISLNKDNAKLFEPYRLNIKTGKLTKLAENDNPMQPIIRWETDHDGKIRVAIKMTGGVNRNILYRDTEEDTFRTLLTTNFRQSVSPQLFTFDNEDLYAISNLNRDKKALVKLDTKTGKEKKVLYKNDKYDISGIDYSRKRETLTTVNYTSWKREHVFLDDQTEKLYKRLNKDLGKYEIAITNHDKAENKYIVRTYSDQSLGSYYFYNQSTDKLRKLADVNADIKEENMAEMKPIKYKSRDGLTIHGYLTTPKGKKAKNLPVVVNPHGGPWHRNSWGFNPEAQFLASRGYAVFQMNFRGSTGYGKEFWEAGFKEWGQKMQNDITDGVHWLIDKGIADSTRIAIYGASYGGYATLAGVTKTPHLYTCAIDYVGVSNLFTFMETIPPYWDPLKDMFQKMVGDPEKDSLMMAKNSPVYHVDKIETPLFIVQGAQDPRVDKNESDQMVRALRKKGIDVPYMVKEDEGHGFQNEENRFQFYKAMAGFLKKHMPPTKSSSDKKTAQL